MPLCDVGAYQKKKGGEEAPAPAHGIRIFYRTYGGGPVKVLLIIGFAGTHKCWLPQIKYLAGTDAPNDGESVVGAASGVEVCAFDNRGMGRSSIPTKKSEYTTRKMAKDAIALMDHLGWQNAHVFGHSMGAMIACKLAAMAPDRVLSLALLNVTGGGYECIPKMGRVTFSLAMRFLRAKTPEQRAAIDLETHYSKEYLEERIENKGTTRRSVLFNDYVKNIQATGMQTKHGFEGQIHACWNHVVRRMEMESIRAGAFPVSVIHGRHDIIAQSRHAKRLAERLYPSARMVELSGGHQLMHENAEEVSKDLVELIKASKCITSLHEWTNIPSKSGGSEASAIILWRTTSSFFVKCTVDKLRVFLAYLFSLFALAFSLMRGDAKRIKPIRVGPALT